jgi:predicted Holliday junction resolvase-like endonuclease
MDLINTTLLFYSFIITYIFYAQKKQLDFYIKINIDFTSQQALMENKILKLTKDNTEFHLENKSLQKSFDSNVLDSQQEIFNLKAKTISLSSEIKDLKIVHKNNLKELEKTTREDTLKRSRSILRGQASEHLAPFVIENTNPKDYRFMGNPVDYICYDGLSDVIDKVADEIKTVRFIDIKTGKSTLNKSQRRIRDAIKANRVSFETINLDEVLNDK